MMRMGGMMASPEPRRPSDKQMVRQHAKSSMRNATEDWVSGRIDTKQHEAIHSRARHVLSGKPVAHFKGKVGERKPTIVKGF